MSPSGPAQPGLPLAARTPPGARSVWIASRWVDLCLIVGVPVFLAPLILLAPNRPGVQELILYLGAFGALGHHLPGMLRAYGDRELFRRFRARFVVAPIFLVTVCVGFSLSGLGGIVLATFLWTTWHTLMQIFGFARIYDAKVGASSAWTGRLDRALCIAWIGAPLAYSDSRVAYGLELYYRCGLPSLATGLVEALRFAWLAATAAVTLAFLAHLALAWKRGSRPNPVKLAFFGASFGFWWFCMVAVEHLVAGIALFDVFHDVQYLAIVWLFQRSRAEHAAESAAEHASAGGVTGFTRFLFRRSGALIGLYVGLVVAYGSLGWFTGLVASETARNVLLGILTASALFHFYLDGFIWKVREPATRATLGLGLGDARMPAASAAEWRWTKHAWKWALFVVPVGWFGYAEARGAADPRARQAAIVEAAPRSAEALTGYGVLLASSGELDRAVELHRRAIALKPGAPEPRNNLGAALRLQGRLDEARAAFEDALRLRPSYARAHGHLANLLAQQGESGLAERHFRLAMEHDAHYADPRANLAVLLLARGDVAAAVPLLRGALALEPDNRGALNNLAWILATSSREEWRAPREALELARRFDALTEHGHPQALDTLAAAQAAAGGYEDAQRTADEAIRAALARGNSALARQIEARRESYRAGRALFLP